MWLSRVRFPADSPRVRFLRIEGLFMVRYVVVLLLIALPIHANPEGYFLAGMNNSTPAGPQGFRRTQSPGTSFSAGFEQVLNRKSRVSLEIDRSRFSPNIKAYSEGGRNWVIGGGASSFLVSGQYRHFLRPNVSYADPFVSFGVGISRFTFDPVDRVDIMDLTIKSNRGSSTTCGAFLAGTGLRIAGPAGSPIHAQFDVRYVVLSGEPRVQDASMRMLLLLSLR
jgi:hypothetical protein